MSDTPAGDRGFPAAPSIGDDFPPVSGDQWQAVAERSLGGRSVAELSTATPEGIAVRPLYTAEDLPEPSGYPGLPPFIRGREGAGAGEAAWEVCQQLTHADPAAAASALGPLLARGVGSAWLVFDRVVRLGLDRDHPRAAGPDGCGLAVSTSAELNPLLDVLDRGQASIHVSAGGSCLAVTALLLAGLRRRGVGRARLDGALRALNCDPLAALAGDGELPSDLDGSLGEMVELAAWSAGQTPGLRAISLSALPYHAAGTTAVQEVAFVLATGVEYLRVLTDAGLGLEEACCQLRAVVGIGRELFMEMAKLRALRGLWADVVRACGGGPASQAIPVHAVTSPRTLTVREPWVNLLRVTVAGFAAVTAGADTLTTAPLDAASGRSGALGLRLAANTHTILREEAHLHRVADPGGGGWYVERLTEDLARAAWSLFQEIEARGGMRASLLDGWIAESVARTLDQRREAVASGRDPITGVSFFPRLDEEPPESESGDRDTVPGRATETALRQRHPARAAGELERLRTAVSEARRDGSVVESAVVAFAAGATLGQVCDCLRAGRERARLAPLPVEREAGAFEALREASDRYRQCHGSWPRVLVACVGELAEHRARADFVRNVLTAGGFETVWGEGDGSLGLDGAGVAPGDAAVAVICASDQRYPEAVPVLARVLKAGGAHRVVVAGRPGEHEAEWRDAGVDAFLYRGCDLVGLLGELQSAAGVRS